MTTGKQDMTKNPLLPISTIKNYIRCPMLYVFKDLLGVNNELNIAMKSQLVAHQVLRYMYYQMLGGATMTFENLTTKMGQIIYNHGETHGILEDEKQDVNYRVHKGLYKYFKRDTGLKYNILLLDKPTVIHIGDSHIETKIDLVREVEEKSGTYIRLDIFPDELISTNQFKTKHDLYHVSQIYAYTKIFKTPPQKIVVHNATSPRQFELKSSMSELRRFETTVKYAYKNIQEDEIYPAHSADCQFCSYKTLCDKYQF